MCVFFFFFSSRRRHTRFDCDWSSDVCSSDLSLARVPATNATTEPGILQLRIISVDSAAAFDVEQQFDGGPNYSSGSVLWTSTRSEERRVGKECRARGQ